MTNKPTEHDSRQITRMLIEWRAVKRAWHSDAGGWKTLVLLLGTVAFFALVLS